MPRLQLIKFNRNTGGAVPPPAASLATQGEPLLAHGGFTGLPAHTGGFELAVDTGTAIVSLVGPQRQIELIGNQNVGGRKTFTLASISITGGAVDQVLRTDGAGNLTWVAPAVGGSTYTFDRGLTEAPLGTVNLDFAGPLPANLGGVYVPPNVGLTVAGDGAISLLAATAALLGGVFVPATATSGLILAPSGQLTLATATPAQFGGVSVPANGGLQLVGPALSVFPATQAEATAGTDAVKPITSAVLQLGADPATLVTTAKTIVPAINELAAEIAAAVGMLTIVGTFNATTGVVTPITGGPIAAGPLPPATQQRVGYFLLVDTAGTPPAGNAPQVPMVVGDMVVCVEVSTAPGTYAWSHLGIGQAVIAASSVTVTAIPGLTATNVQQALAELQLNKLDGPLVIDGSLAGDGTAGSPLAVAVVDGGTFP